ncbi:hypothetical protein Pmani_027304 [Petrolisthes manimaculis]|uniref:Uncharacterized protein n=1 Tax=Petrolisthes manimaculis TaxID=1843537 RepID=A0AAE1P3T4_9EUCA|nr:hypothetical protein Pmani_027304 [Petrolisthes manimaculis]
MEGWGWVEDEAEFEAEDRLMKKLHLSNGDGLNERGWMTSLDHLAEPHQTRTRQMATKSTHSSVHEIWLSASSPVYLAFIRLVWRWMDLHNCSIAT